MKKHILVLNGPNLNLLGKREPTIYGSTTLSELYEQMEQVAKKKNLQLTFFQSNHEGELIDKIQTCFDKYDGIIFNPAAFTHYSYAIADALRSVNLPIVEVHISNIYQREDFRKHSVISPIAIGQISGLGLYGYEAAVCFFAEYLNR